MFLLNILYNVHIIYFPYYFTSNAFIKSAVKSDNSMDFHFIPIEMDTLLFQACNIEDVFGEPTLFV